MLYEVKKLGYGYQEFGCMSDSENTFNLDLKSILNSITPPNTNIELINNFFNDLDNKFLTDPKNSNIKLNIILPDTKNLTDENKIILSQLDNRIAKSIGFQKIELVGTSDKNGELAGQLIDEIIPYQSRNNLLKGYDGYLDFSKMHQALFSLENQNKSPETVVKEHLFPAEVDYFLSDQIVQAFNFRYSKMQHSKSSDYSFVTQAEWSSNWLNYIQKNNEKINKTTFPFIEAKLGFDGGSFLNFSSSLRDYLNSSESINTQPFKKITIEVADLLNKDRGEINNVRNNMLDIMEKATENNIDSIKFERSFMMNNLFDKNLKNADNLEYELTLISSMLEDLSKSSAYKNSRTFLDLDDLIGAKSVLENRILSYGDETNKAILKEIQDIYIQLQGQIAKNQREYNKELRAGNLSPTDELKKAISTSPTGIIKRDRGNALNNVSSEINQQQEQQEEQQQEQQEEQQVELQQQRQSNIQSLKDRMNTDGDNKLKKSKADYLSKEIFLSLPQNFNIQVNTNTWENIAGKKLSSEQAKIVAISPQVAEMLFKNPIFFRSGLSLDSLPPGFILHEDKDNPKELILDFSTTKHDLDLVTLEEDNNKKSIYLTTENRVGQSIEWVGDERQFIGLSKEDFKTISDYGLLKKLSPEERIGLIIRFMNSEAPNFIDVQKADIINRTVSTYFNATNTAFIASLLNKYGAQGPYLIFEKTFRLENKFGQDLTKRFVELFLTNSSVSYDAILIPSRLTAFSELTKLSPNEFSLFIQLCENDCKIDKDRFNPNADIEQRLKDFNNFKNELKNLGIDLNLTTLNAESSYFKNQNMAVIMQRIVTILKNSIDPIAQFKHLDRLDFSPYKAYQAISEDGYCFVTNDMKFGDDTYDKMKGQLITELSSYTTKEFLGDDALSENFKSSLNSSFSEFIYLNNFLALNNQKLPPEYYFEGLFLRTVGKSYNADQYSDYVAINMAYQSAYGKYSAKYDRRIKSVSAHALAITAFATVHENALKIDASLYTKMVDQLMTDSLQGDRGINLCQSLLSYLHLADNPEVKRPQLEQISSLIEFHKALGIDHPWNAQKFNKKDSLLDLYHPDKITFLKITEKLGESYFEVIHNNYLFRPEDKANESAKNIASIATTLSDNQLFKDISLLDHRNNLFKILSYCDYNQFSNQEISDFIATNISNFDKNKLSTTLDILASVKFKDGNAPHPTFEELKSVLDKINLLDNASEDKVFNTIRNASGFSDCIFPSKKAAEYNGDKLKQLIQDNLDEIRPHLVTLGINWEDKFSDDPKLLIKAISEAVKGNPLKQGMIQFAINHLFAIMEDGSKTSINDHILHTLGTQDKNDITITNIETDTLVQVLEKRYFDNLDLKSGVEHLGQSLDILDNYEKQAIEFVDKLAIVKNANSVAYKNSIKYLNDSPDLNKISLENLTVLIDTLSKKYKAKFPSTLLQTIISHPMLKDMDSDKTHALLNDAIIPKIINNKNLGLNIKELNSLISSVITISANKDIELRNINTILSLLNNKETKNDLITIIQSIAKTPTPELINNIRVIAPIVENTPEIRTSFYSKFNGRLDDLSSIGKSLNNQNLNLTEDEKKNILIILSKTKYIYSGNNKDKPDNKLDDLLNKMASIPDNNKRAEFLSKIAALSLPIQITYPGASELIDAVTTNKNAEDVIKNLYDKLEKSRNDPIELDKRFDANEVNRVLETMQNLEHGAGLGYPQKKQLQEQFHIVNHLGRHVELAVDLTQPDGKKNFIKNMDDSEIKNLLSQYRNTIRDANKSQKERDNDKLIYLALLRESMYRSTGRFPFSTQILAVLSAMNQNGNNIAEIQTGQGKSLMSSLYAAMLHAEGQAVDIATSNLQLAKEGLHENKEYYAYIGVKASVATASMDFGDYNHDGINYSDVPQLALFRSRAYIEGGKLPDKVSMVLDEADYTLLDDKTQYRYAASLDPTAPSQNIFAWVYPLINKFIDDPNQSETPDNLRAYLMQNAPSRYSRMIQNKEFLSDKQLDTWINAAISAEALYKQKDIQWTLRQEEKNGKLISAAKLITNHTVSQDAQWSNGVHQFVHARINEDNKEAIESGKFPSAPIDPEKSALASLTSKNFIDFYVNRKGKIWGMTGTIGSLDEKREHAEKFGFKLFSLPPHQKEQRITHDPILIDSDNEHKQAIFNEILKRIRKKEKMPSLIICKDPKTAEELHEFIQKELQKSAKNYPLTLQLISGIKTTQQNFEPNTPLSEPNAILSEENAVKQASVAGTITISTPMLGRGTDFKPVEDKINDVTNERNKHPHGLFVVQSYVDIERTSRQVSGRSGRQGAKGEAMTLISKEALEKDLKSVNIQEDEIKKKKVQDYVQKIRDKRNYTAKEQRQQTEVLGDIRNLYFNKMLLIKDNMAEHYNKEKDKYNLEMKKEKPEDRNFDNIDAKVINYSDVDLYRVSLLKNWETFLLDLDLKKAELLLSEKKLDINELASALITHANDNWKNQTQAYDKLLEKPENTAARSLDKNNLPIESNKIIKKAHITREEKPTTESLTRRLSTNINPDKLVCRVFSKPNQALVNKATETELNAIYKETLICFKKNHVSKSFYPQFTESMTVDQKVSVLYDAVNHAHAHGLVTSPASMKQYDYLMIRNKIEQSVKWHLDYSPDEKHKNLIKNVLLTSYKTRSNDFIQYNKFDTLLQYQQGFLHRLPGFGITAAEYEKFISNDRHLGYGSTSQMSIVGQLITKFNKDLEKSQKKYAVMHPATKQLYKEIYQKTNAIVKESTPSTESMLDILIAQRKITYFGDSVKNIKSIPSGNSYHRKLDNIIAGIIATGDKFTLEKAYSAQINEANIIINYVKIKYADRPDLIKACDDKISALTKNDKNPADIVNELRTLQLLIPSDTLKMNLGSTIKHIQAIQAREKLFDLTLQANVTPIVLADKSTETKSFFKKPLSFLANKISPHRTIVEILTVQSPAEKINVVQTNPSVSSASPVNGLLPILHPEKTSIVSEPKKIIENFHDSQNKVMVQIQLDKTTGSNGRITLAEGVDIKSEGFKLAAKAAINKVVASATSSSTFKISERLPEPTKSELTEHLKQKLNDKFPDRNNEAVINPKSQYVSQSVHRNQQ